MEWSIEEIEQHLLHRKITDIALPSEKIVGAVNRIGDVLGTEWITSESSAKGLSPAMRIISMGLRLTSLDGVRESEELIEQIRRKDPSAEAELTAIYLFRSNDPLVEVELHPAVGSRKADFRLRRGTGPWTTAEVTRAATSKEQQRINAILRRLADALSKIDAPFALEVLFRREPTDDEVSLLCERLPEFCKLPGEQQAALVDEMGFLFLNHTDVGRLLLHELPELADTPLIGLVTLVGGGPDGGPHHQVAVRIPFSDKRAEQFLTAEARQLPKEGRGLVMIEGPSSASELKVWSPLVQRRFQPRIHTRVSGVCLFAGGMVPVAGRYNWLVQAKLLTNPHAKAPLPDWIRAAVEPHTG